jgi:transposase InsO family protein
MDLGDQADRVKFMIRDRGSNFTTAFDAVLADAGIRTVLCNVRTPRMNAIAERWHAQLAREPHEEFAGAIPSRVVIRCGWPALSGCQLARRSWKVRR